MRRSFYLPESKVHYPRSKDFHVEHVRIQLEVDFEAKRISGECTLRIVPFHELNVVRLDACEMEVHGALIDGSESEFQHDNQTLGIRASHLDATGHTVTVRYTSFPRDGVYFIGPDEKFPRKPIQAWTHSEAEFARYWFPCYDYPNDRFTSETIITVPTGFTVISNGVLVSRSEEDSHVTYHWKEDRPHASYLTSFIAGEFSELTGQSEGVPLHYFVPESKLSEAKNYFGETPRMIKVFNEITGVGYPYAKYAQTTVEDFIFGGMENIDATTLATTRFHAEKDAEDFQVSYSLPNRTAVSLVSHELAHQWFGDLVTCSDWSHAWLNEGFSDYMQLMYTERTRGRDELRWDMFVNAQDVFSQDENEYRRPIVERNYVYPDDVFDDTTYKKGAWMIHELRYLLGDNVFFEGINEYLKRYSYKNADTQDFMKIMEETSGLSLEKFFEQSFMMAGHPEFEVDYSWNDNDKTANVTIRQVQSNEFATPVFSLPADLVFCTHEGRKEKRVELFNREHSFSFELDSEPRIVEFDPQQWLLKKVKFPKSVLLLTNQLEEGQDASSRAEAARSLGELKAAQGIESLKEAATKEQFWHVNASAILALGEIGSTKAAEALFAIGKPVHRRTRRALAEALGNFKDKRALEILEELLKSDPSPYVRCEAALSLSKAAGRDCLPFLKEAMKVKTPNETLSEACLEAMGRHDDSEVRKIFRESLAYGKPTRTRIGAMKGMKLSGRIEGEEVPILEEILLNDPEYAVRDHLAAKLIRGTRDTRFLEALQRSSKTDRDYRVRRSSLDTYHQLVEGSQISREVTELREEIERLKSRSSRGD